MIERDSSHRKQRRLWKLGCRSCLTVVALFAVGWWVLPWVVPLPESLGTSREASVRFVSDGGQPLRLLLDGEGQWSGPEHAFEEIPDVLVEATLAAEDQRFFRHGGVDLLAIGRAVRDNVSSGRVISGASTIHQQLVKISTTRRRRDLLTKLREALQARRLAMSSSREVVMANYLNRIYYGNLFVGCSAACQGYFAKPLSDLTAAEAAFISVIPRAPTRLNPFRHFQGVRLRQLRVLDQMHALGFLSESELKIARAQNVVLQRFVGGFEAPHAIEWLRTRHDLEAEEVRTTLALPLQTEVERILRRRMDALQDKHATQAAAIVLENETGWVRAWVGSREFRSEDGGQINGGWTPRSPGSALKPFTYALAFERGDTPATMVADLPIEFPTPTGIYRPENYDLRFFGPMTYRSALGNSLNVAAVRVLDRVGGAKVLKARLEELGIQTLDQPAEHYGLGLTIGNAPVRLVELVNAYATLARLGEWRPWTLLADSADAETRQVIEPMAAWMIADVLRDNQARELTFGRRSPLRMAFPVAVKTGTSSEYRDNWTLGYTPEFTVGVWMGNFDRSPMSEVSGASGSAAILRDIFEHLNEREDLSWYERPEAMIRVRIDPRTGHRLTPQSPPARMSREESLPKGRLPLPATAADYDARGRALIGPEYAEWSRSEDNWMGDLIALGDPDSSPARLEIVHPIPGTQIQLDPDLPQGGRVLILRTRVQAEELSWQCETLEIENDDGIWMARLVPGHHRLEVRDGRSGQVARTEITVFADGAER